MAFGAGGGSIGSVVLEFHISRAQRIPHLGRKGKTAAIIAEIGPTEVLDYCYALKGHGKRNHDQYGICHSRVVFEEAHRCKCTEYYQTSIPKALIGGRAKMVYGTSTMLTAG